MSINPKVSFITITFNGMKDTIELIKSIQTVIQSVPYEIIIVDNASKINEAKEIGRQYPNITCIRSEKNLGFSGGNNIGIRASKGEFLFLINNDTIIEEDNLAKLLERLDDDDKIGALSPKIRFEAQPRNIQYAGFTPLSRITLRNCCIGYGKKDDGSYDQPQPTSYLHGAAMLVKREIIEKVGEMPDIYFLYYEEVDWSTQIIKKGYSLWYEPCFTVFHKESQSTGQNSPLKNYYMTRNRLLYAYRNLPKLPCFISILYQLTISTGKNIVCNLISGNINAAKAAINGTSDFFKLIVHNNKT